MSLITHEVGEREDKNRQYQHVEFKLVRGKCAIVPSALVRIKDTLTCYEISVEKKELEQAANNALRT